MSTFVIVGKRLIPREHIALVEPFEPSSNPRFNTTRPFLSRVVMVNRDSILIEESVSAFAEANGFRLLSADRVATNPAVHFRVETFLPAEGFRPARAYASRLLWRDLDSNDQSKLLLSYPETVLAVVVQGQKVDLPAASEKTTRPPRRKGRTTEAATQPADGPVG
jgi:hypothetical protein